MVNLYKERTFSNESPIKHFDLDDSQLDGVKID